MKVAVLYNSTESGTGRDLGDYVWFYCPGCKGHHRARVRMPKNPTPQEISDQRRNIHGLWTWNNNEEKPTIRASILVGADSPGNRCHSFVTDGKIQYCNDCDHELSGKTVDLPEIKL